MPMPYAQVAPRFEPMDAQPREDRPELAQAFGTFTRLSSALASSYEDLQRHVVRLAEELARTREARERELDESRRLAARLGLLLENLPAGVVVLDGEGVVQECNPAARALLGQPLDEVVWREVVRRAFVPRPDDGHDISLDNGRRVNISTCSLHPEPGQILLVKDVTETRQLQDRLAQLRRLSSMGEMAASIGHQIRTPLASALLYANGLGSARLDAAARMRFSGQLREVLQHLSRLVDDMLAYARSGGYALEEVETVDLCRDLEALLGDQLGPAGEHYRLRCEAPETALRGNRGALRSVVQNLIDNARTAAGDGLEVAVEVAAEGAETLVVRVCDNGPGVPPELAGRLFEPFVTGSGGTGLGLAVARSIVRAHGGELALEESGPSGSRFRLRLPLARAGGEGSGIAALARSTQT